MNLDMQREATLELVRVIDEMIPKYSLSQEDCCRVAELFRAYIRHIPTSVFVSPPNRTKD